MKLGVLNLNVDVPRGTNYGNNRWRLGYDDVALPAVNSGLWKVRSCLPGDDITINTEAQYVCLLVRLRLQYEIQGGDWGQECFACFRYASNKNINLTFLNTRTGALADFWYTTYQESDHWQHRFSMINFYDFNSYQEMTLPWYANESINTYEDTMDEEIDLSLLTPANRKCLIFESNMSSYAG